MKNNVEDIAKSWLLESDDNTDIGLIKGKAGLCLFYFLYSRYGGNAVLEDLAEELLYEVTEGITNETPIWFGDGLAGIGWAVIFLYQHHYIDGDVNIILNCCDRLITQWDVRRVGNTSLEKGLRGIAAYVTARSYRLYASSPFSVMAISNAMHRASSSSIVSVFISCSSFVLPAKLSYYFKISGFYPEQKGNRTSV